MTGLLTRAGSSEFGSRRSKPWGLECWRHVIDVRVRRILGNRTLQLLESLCQLGQARLNCSNPCIIRAHGVPLTFISEIRRSARPASLSSAPGATLLSVERSPQSVAQCLRVSKGCGYQTRRRRDGVCRRISSVASSRSYRPPTPSTHGGDHGELGCDIAVRDGRMVGIRGRGVDIVNHGRLGPKGFRELARCRQPRSPRCAALSSRKVANLCVSGLGEAGGS